MTTRRNETVRSDEQLTARIEILRTSDNAVRSTLGIAVRGSIVLVLMLFVFKVNYHCLK